MTSSISVTLSREEAKKLILELEALGNMAYDTGMGDEDPVSGWVFAHLLHDLDLVTNGMDNHRDFGEDGGS